MDFVPYDTSFTSNHIIFLYNTPSFAYFYAIEARSCFSLSASQRPNRPLEIINRLFCAELWWGTHKSAPADVYIDEADQAATVPLAEIIGADPALVLGESTANSFQNELPYLLKVRLIRSF